MLQTHLLLVCCLSPFLPPSLPPPPPPPPPRARRPEMDPHGGQQPRPLLLRPRQAYNHGNGTVRANRNFAWEHDAGSDAWSVLLRPRELLGPMRGLTRWRWPTAVWNDGGHGHGHDGPGGQCLAGARWGGAVARLLGIPIPRARGGATWRRRTSVECNRCSRCSECNSCSSCSSRCSSGRCGEW